jgi:hypothetical protein
MADAKHVRVLSLGVVEWNRWRRDHPDIQPDLRKARLHGADLVSADLDNVLLAGADLSGADLRGANLSAANLSGANLGDANLLNADLCGADLTGAKLDSALLAGAIYGADTAWPRSYTPNGVAAVRLERPGRVSAGGSPECFVIEGTHRRRSWLRRVEAGALALVAVCSLVGLAGGRLTGLADLALAHGLPVAAPAAPTPTPVPTPTPPLPTPTPPQLLYVSADGDGVFIRSKPDMEAKIRVWPDGTEMQALAVDADGAALDWVKVRAPDGYIGYIPSRWLSPSRPATAPTQPAGRSAAAQAAPATATVGPNALPTASPITSPAAASLGIAILSLTSPVSTNSDATLQIRTAPSANCSVTVYNKSGPIRTRGLDDVTADGQGLCAWAWRMAGAKVTGAWSIDITVTGNGLLARQTAPFVVR